MRNTLIIMRHAQPDDNGNHLTPTGLHQAADVATQLQNLKIVPDRILHSPLLRAAETAQRLRQVFAAEAKRDIPTLAADWLAEQCRPKLNNISAEAPGETLLLVTHMTTIRALSVPFLTQASFKEIYLRKIQRAEALVTTYKPEKDGTTPFRAAHLERTILPRLSNPDIPV